jgi:hypothetical protein
MSEVAAVLLDRSLRLSEHETALEVGWLLAELERRFGCGLDELARRFDRSASWVSRRLALVELLPEAIQQQVGEGELAAQVAMKYLVPVARVDAEQCARMAAAFVERHCDTRQAGQLYTAWRNGTRAVRERILSEPELFLKTQRQSPVARPVTVEQVCPFGKAAEEPKILKNGSRFRGCGSVLGQGGRFCQLAGARLLLEPLAHLGGRECFRIERTPPPQHVVMFFVSGIGQHRQVFFMPGRSSDVFWGSAAFAADARRILRGRLRQQDGLQHQVMLPAITEVI